MRHGTLVVGFFLLQCAGCSCGDPVGDGRPDTGRSIRPDADTIEFPQGDTGTDAPLDAGGSACLPSQGDLAGCGCTQPEQTRPCWTGPEASRGRGACADGVQTCTAAGELATWSACTGETAPVAEACANTADDDCDGLTDCADSDCAGVGSCAPECAAGVSGACYTGPENTSGVGLCRPGTRLCSAGGKWEACTAQVTPAAEDCGNNADDDCDGQTDCADSDCAAVPRCVPECTHLATAPCYTGPAGTSGVGACRPGTTTCGADQRWGACLDDVKPAGENCANGVDDDCDNATDCADPDCAAYPACVAECTGTSTAACYTGPAGTENVGACRGGSKACAGGKWGPCTGEVKPQPEACGSPIDEDCDGQTDCDDADCRTFPACIPECMGGSAPCYTGPAGTSGVGICRPGSKSCLITGKWGPCTGEVHPGDEGFFDFNGSCKDGLDNDCDGTSDCQQLDCFIFESSCAPTLCTGGQTQACYTGPSGTNNVGLCHGGTQTCASDGKSWGACGGQVLPVLEGLACADGQDNDCNGKADCQDLGCSTALACCTPASSTPAEMTIWAHSSDALYQIDPTTFATTLVGSFGITDMTDLAVTPTGTLYGISFSALYRVDRATAHATYVAPLSGSVNNGLTFLSDGTLLASDGSGQVKQIDPNNGTVTDVGTFGNGLSSSGDLVAVQGVMYGISSTTAGGGDAGGNNVLLRVDVATGKATVVGPIGFGNVWGLAYVKGRVIAFTNAGKIIQVDPQTGVGTEIATRNIAFWGAGMSPLTPVNPCP